MTSMMNKLIGTFMVYDSLQNLQHNYNYTILELDT